MEQVKAIVQETELFVFDCDGVVWHGNTVVPGAAETLDVLRSQGKKISFVTNNSTKSRQVFADKFHRLGISWVEASDIWTSAYATAAFLKHKAKLSTDKKVYVVGEQGLVDELEAMGYSCIGGPAHRDSKVEPASALEVDPEIGAVAVGFDIHINYFKLAYATVAATTLPDCIFIATNKDNRAHLNPMQEFPGGGTMVAALETAIGYPPEVAGKPSPFLMQAVRESHGISEDTRVKSCMVGDRLDTDIMFGNSNDMTTVLVLSGVTTEEMTRDISIEAQKPSCIVSDITKLA